MGISFPSGIEDLNITDFDVMRVLYLEGPMWKMEITREINSHRAKENLTVEREESITKQAVARRVDRLHQLDYLETAIISLGDVDVEKKPDRDFIEGYRISEKGKDTLENVLRSILLDALVASIRGDESIACYDILYLYSEVNDQEISSLEDFVGTELSS